MEGKNSIILLLLVYCCAVLAEKTYQTNYVSSIPSDIPLDVDSIRLTHGSLIYIYSCRSL